MNHRWVVVIGGVLSSVLVRADTLAQQTPFRAATDLVTVDVTVRSGGDAVAGLTAADFVLLDNGVPQRIESVERSSIPVDVTLVVDVSGGLSGVMGSPAPNERVRVAQELTTDVAKTQKILRPGDRLRLLTIDDYATQVLPLKGPDTPVTISNVATDGLAALHDGLVGALLHEVEPNRRHFVVAFTKGFDTISGVDGAVLREVARRSDALLYVVQDDAPLLREDNMQDCQCLLMRLCKPTTRFVTPVRRRNPSPTACELGSTALPAPRAGRQIEVLAEAAASTGGQLFDAGVFASRDPVDTFKTIFDRFRQGYVLRYAPQGVKRDGWHEITVTIPAQTSYVVQSRRGYAIETPAPLRPPAAASAAARGATSAPVTLESVLDSYARGDYATVNTTFRQPRDLGRLLREFRAAGSAWPDSPRRDAVFALELAVAGLLSPERDTREDGQALLVQYHALVRQPLGADAFECAWYWTASAALQGMVRPSVGVPFVTGALARCPNEPRLRLAHAILVDQRWPLGTTTPTPGSRFMLTPTPDQERDVPRLYAEAMALRGVAVEARVRAAFFAYRTGQLDRALALLEPAGVDTQDRPVRYLAWLFRGHVLRAQGQVEESAKAYREALAIWPGAQAARVGLMTALLSRDDRAGAGAVALEIQQAPATQFDPWWQYWQGDVRAFSGILNRLRELAR